MVTLLSEIHFWTTQEDIILKNTDYGSFKYVVFLLNELLFNKMFPGTTTKRKEIT